MRKGLWAFFLYCAFRVLIGWAGKLTWCKTCCKGGGGKVGELVLVLLWVTMENSNKRAEDDEDNIGKKDKTNLHKTNNAREYVK